MKQIAVVLAGILLAVAAHAGDVYVTKDAKGNTIYTDTPQTLPAEKVTVQGQGNSQPATAQQGSPETQPKTRRRTRHMRSPRRSRPRRSRLPRTRLRTAPSAAQRPGSSIRTS